MCCISGVGFYFLLKMLYLALGEAMRRMAWLLVFALTGLNPRVGSAQTFGWTCERKCVDAAVSWSNKTAYLFNGSQYVRFSGDEPDDGYPLPIAGNWPGFPATWSSGINAAVNWRNGKVYFFRGDQYL